MKRDMDLVRSILIAAERSDGPLDVLFDYQSECHCSKTGTPIAMSTSCLITSQNATAPKRGAPFLDNM